MKQEKLISLAMNFASFLVERVNIKRIILYGSVVDGTLTLRSDIDIAVKFSTISLSEATLFRKRILGKTSSRVDLQVFNILSPVLQQEIKSKGKVIYAPKT